MEYSFDINNRPFKAIKINGGICDTYNTIK